MPEEMFIKVSAVRSPEEAASDVSIGEPWIVSAASTLGLLLHRPWSAAPSAKAASPADQQTSGSAHQFGQKVFAWSGKPSLHRPGHVWFRCNLG
jgi:hypothetical protein